MTIEERNQLEPGTVVKVDMTYHPYGMYFPKSTIKRWKRSDSKFYPELRQKSVMKLAIVSYNPSSIYTKFVVYRWEEPFYFEINLNQIEKL